MEETVFRPNDLMFTRSADPSEDLKFALKGLVALAPTLNTKYIRMRAEVLAAACKLFEMEYNSDDEIYLAGIEVIIVSDLPVPFEFVSEKSEYLPKGIVFHDSIFNRGIYGGRY